MSHTPGPWTWESPNVYDADNELIAYLLSGAEVNGPLIAAAPDLLSLAQQTRIRRSAALAFGDEATVTRLAGQFAPLADAARNALAKIEGREP